jgi:hypothetical protein
MAPVTDVKASRLHPGAEGPAVDALDLQLADGELPRIRRGHEDYLSTAAGTRLPG